MKHILYLFIAPIIMLILNLTFGLDMTINRCFVKGPLAQR